MPTYSKTKTFSPRADETSPSETDPLVKSPFNSDDTMLKYYGSHGHFAHIRKWLAIAGPGMIVMLADTDAGCLITAGQSGAVWGYSLVPLQLVLIPIVYMAQELTIRLGVLTQMGQIELIKDRYGNFWAWLCTICLIFNCVGALICEITAVVALGELGGIPKWITTLVLILGLISVVLTGSYRRVEVVCVLVGLFELVFVITMVMAAPSPIEFIRDIKLPITNGNFLYLMAANIGAVVMPWMIFYQQSAIVAKGTITEDEIPYARFDTAIGSCLTQLVMIAVLMTTAGTVWDGHFPGASKLDTVGDFSTALTSQLGELAGVVLFSLGLMGGALIGAVVVTLTATWTIGEMTGFKRSLEARPSEAPWFYGMYALILAATAAIALSPFNAVQLNVGVQVFNAILLPLILLFLFLLSSSDEILPENYRLQGWYQVCVGVTFAFCSIISLGAALVGCISSISSASSTEMANMQV